LQVAVGLDQLERFLDRGGAEKADAERVVERARSGIEAFDKLPQFEMLVIDHQDAAGGLRHQAATIISRPWPPTSKSSNSSSSAPRSTARRSGRATGPSACAGSCRRSAATTACSIRRSCTR